MKKLIPLFALILLLSSCSNHSSKATETETNRENKQIETIHTFIEYLKSDNLKGAQAMLQLQDTTSYEGRENYNYETGQIDSAWSALKQDDIADDSFWLSDTSRQADGLNLYIATRLKKDMGRVNNQSLFCFTFSLSNSDTVLNSFFYTSSIPETKLENKLRRTIYQFIGYLKSNDTQDALAMFRFNDKKTLNNNRSKNYIDNQTIELNNIRFALQQNDINDISWKLDTSTTPSEHIPVFFIAGNMKAKPGSPYSKSLFLFEFAVFNSDTELISFARHMPK